MKKLVFFILLFATLQTQATHINGGQITSRCIGGLTQEVTLTLYWDTQGIPMPNSVYVNYVGNNLTWTNTRNVYQTSSYFINSTTMAYEYVDTVTFPNIDNYTISYVTCCRSMLITNINWTAYTTLYVETMTFVDSTCNSTPIVPVTPCPHAIVNVQSTHSLNAYDLDGDSLGYELITPLEDVYIQLSGYVFPPITITNTGVLIINSPVIGIYDIAVKVTEYRNGIEIGHVLREMQIVVDGVNGINEVENTKSINYNECDILGRKINNNYNGVKLQYK